MTYSKQNRFIDNNVPKPQGANHHSIFEYEDSPLMTLEEAIEKLIPLIANVKDYALRAKQQCNPEPALLTTDESAAIYLYTMPKEIFRLLNAALRDPNRRCVKPWLDFLKLLITALKKLPPVKAKLWRAVDHNAISDFTRVDVYTYWSISSWSTDIGSVRPFLNKNDTGTLFSIETIYGKDISKFSAIPDEEEVILMPGTSVRVRGSIFEPENHLFIIDLEEINFQSVLPDEPNDLYEQIKQKYLRHGCIERFMNPSKTYPIEQSYINLAIVKAKEQDEKERQLSDTQHTTDLLGTFEQIYGNKTSIDPKKIFETCKNAQNQVLVFGRAGIGKSTFCQYIAYQWAIGSYWPRYELLALIPLRRLTDDRYRPLPLGQDYSLIDLVKKEIFPFDLSEKEEELLERRFNAKTTLWILDGYDEIADNVPPHLQRLFEQLIKTPHHIITSRPYLNTLSYEVQMEITGFTDGNIVEYIQRFFDQMKDELHDATIKCQTLLKYLESNKSTWGVAHIPMLLELICSLWSNENWSETEQVTITKLYTKMIEWLCRRYLRSHNTKAFRLSDDEIDESCAKELAFLESLAYNAMENNTILIRSSILRKSLKESKVSLQDHPHILNIGILKSLSKQGTGSRIESNKDHYFNHLSFQEYFAARYLISSMKSSQTEKAVEFIKKQKYNQRFQLVFNFTAGLLSDSDADTSFNDFWKYLLGEPFDLVGIRHIQLVISCLEEIPNKSNTPTYAQLLEWIGECIKHSLATSNQILQAHLLQSLRRAPSIGCHQTILNVFNNLLQQPGTDIKTIILSFLSNLKISNPPTALIKSIVNILDDTDSLVRITALFALAELGEKAATNEMITKLISILHHAHPDVQNGAYEVLLQIAEKAPTNDMITMLVSALGDRDFSVRVKAHKILGKIGEKAAVIEVITKLVSALGDQDHYVRWTACEILGKMGDKAATNEVITKLVSVLGDQDHYVRRTACEILGKMGDKAATNEVITKLVSALEDQDHYVRQTACEVLGKMGDKAATDEVITKLVSALEDQDHYVRRTACEVLGEMGDKAATDEVITKLVSALADKDNFIRKEACLALGKMGDKAATDEVITKLVSALGDQDHYVGWAACEVLGKMGEKAATNEVITKLVSALGDQDHYVRRTACEVLGKMVDKAAMNEVITKLVSALADEDNYIRNEACLVLGKMGDKAATNEVITKLVSALGDAVVDVRREAWEALGKMGEKAATNEMITKLVSALGDAVVDVRREACEALGKMGEKAATNEVITKLLSTLDDKDIWVREKACVALGEMGEKAAMNEVIMKLASALGDEDVNVRTEACKALERMGEKAATMEVITKLLSALGDQDWCVRIKAHELLGKIGWKAATNEVITKLVSALGDEDVDVRRKACEVLGLMGEKAATNEVITKLVSALDDEDVDVRRKACDALRWMGKKARTTEVITKLVSALGDVDVGVRRNACEVLEWMDEKAVMNEVIAKLVSALGDVDVDVRRKACEVLGWMGKEVYTDEVITKLVSALADEDNYIRKEACLALGKMGDKVATNEVITKLVSALGDEVVDVRREACEVLGKMGEKAATNQVMREIVILMNIDDLSKTNYRRVVENILNSSTVIKQLAPEIVASLFLSRYASSCFRNVSESELIDIFFTTKDPGCLAAVTQLIVDRGAAVTTTGEKVMVYGNKEPVEVTIATSELRKNLIDAFTAQRMKVWGRNSFSDLDTSWS